MASQSFRRDLASLDAVQRICGTAGSGRGRGAGQAGISDRENRKSRQNLAFSPYIEAAARAL
jgi:hypothetical protein